MKIMLVPIQVSMMKIDELKYDLLPHPLYSPDLAPFDFHLFPHQKKFLGEQRLPWETDVADEEVKEAVTEYLANLEESYFRSKRR